MSRVCRISEIEVEGSRDADLDTHIYEDGDHAIHEMLEFPWAFCVGCVCDLLRIGDRHEAENDESEEEHAHCDEEDRVDVRDHCLGRKSSDKGSYEHRGKGSEEGIEGAADLDVLVAVLLATEEGKHRVDHGVEHTYGET